MNLKALDFKKAYSSEADDILNDFYIPALQASIEYKRLAGFFSSTSLAIAARGILGLIQNGGTIELIASPKLYKDDVETIMNASENPEKYIEKRMLDELENLENSFVKNHIFALSWMIANKKMNIRIAIAYDTKRIPLSYEEIQRTGLFHQKIGILKDQEGNVITFSGSINETALAWVRNIEEFKVFRDWELSEQDYVRADTLKFEEFWNNSSKRVDVVDIPFAVEKKLVEMAPRNVNTLGLAWHSQEEKFEHDTAEARALSFEFRSSIVRDIDNLRDYQQTAIQKWEQNNRKGILEMATGSGKTFCAIIGSYYLYLEIGSLLIVVLVPSKQLVRQWGEVLGKYTDNIIMISSDQKYWRNLIGDYIPLFKSKKIDHLYIISTIDSYITSVKKTISSIPNEHMLIVADEAHWLGASETRKNFEGNIFVYSLGLTATPVRYFDDEGTTFLYNFLGEPVYEFSIKEAQEHRFLCKYNYRIMFCDLNEEELREYLKLTKAISISFTKSDEERTTILLNKRAKVIKDAVSKFEEFDNLLTELKDNIEYSVVYCDEDQIDIVCRILREHDILFGVFLGVTPDVERQVLISNLMSRTIDTIVAIKCLNEGVDIPPLKQGFFLSSSGNPREFIQRRGRLLRTYEGKGIVDIYDFVVVPDLDQLDLSDTEKKVHGDILRKELKRIKEFNGTALNSAANERKLLKELDVLLCEEIQ